MTDGTSTIKTKYAGVVTVDKLETGKLQKGQCLLVIEQSDGTETKVEAPGDGKVTFNVIMGDEVAADVTIVATQGSTDIKTKFAGTVKALLNVKVKKGAELLTITPEDGTDPKPVTAPNDGGVILKVKTGDTVDADDPVAELTEAPASTSLKSPVKGTVRAVLNVTAGRPVKAGQGILAVEHDVNNDVEKMHWIVAGQNGTVTLPPDVALDKPVVAGGVVATLVPNTQVQAGVAGTVVNRLQTNGADVLAGMGMLVVQTGSNDTTKKTVVATAQGKVTYSVCAGDTLAADTVVAEIAM